MNHEFSFLSVSSYTQLCRLMAGFVLLTSLAEFLFCLGRRHQNHLVTSFLAPRSAPFRHCCHLVVRYTLIFLSTCRGLHGIALRRVLPVCVQHYTRPCFDVFCSGGNLPSHTPLLLPRLGRLFSTTPRFYCPSFLASHLPTFISGRPFSLGSFLPLKGSTTFRYFFLLLNLEAWNLVCVCKIEIP